MWCIGCHRLTDGRLCQACRNELERHACEAVYQNRCRDCGNPVLDEAYDCDFCKQRLLYFGWYDGLLESLIGLYKHSGDYTLAWLVADLFETMLTSYPDAVLLPIPSSKEGRRDRGFDQMAFVARILGHRQDRSVVRLFKQNQKSRFTKLGGRQRRAASPLGINKRAIKRMNRLVKEMRPFIILDDVYTTGTTCRSAVQLLSQIWDVDAICCVLAKD